MGRIGRGLVILCFMLGLLLPLPEAVLAEEAESFRVIGYYSADLFDEPLAELPLGQMSHVMYAFLIPAADGSVAYVPKPELLAELTAAAHRQGVQVFIAVGGWSDRAGQPLAPVFETLARSAESRQVFVEQVCSFVRQYGLDGVELDWEYPQASSETAYEALVLELAAALHAEGKELTAALSGAWAVDAGPEVSLFVSTACLKAFDFIEIMGYDTNNADHSPYWFSQTSLAYWQRRGVPQDKLVLGMPLYARPSWLQYRHLTAADPANAWRDFVPAGTLSQQDSYYNGLPLLRAKAMLARAQGGGVMLFDVNEDSHDETSVLTMLAQEEAQYQALGADTYYRRAWLQLGDQPLQLRTEQGQPFVDDQGRTQVPLRGLLESLAIQVDYQAEGQRITLQKGNTVLTLTIGSPLLTCNGQVQRMDSQPLLSGGRTYLPVRQVLEAFGYQVQWQPVTRVLTVLA